MSATSLKAEQGDRNLQVFYKFMPLFKYLRSILPMIVKKCLRASFLSLTAVPIDTVQRRLEAHAKLGVKLFFTLTNTNAIPRNWRGLVGRINEQVILRAVPDYQERTYYLSGPPDMVKAYEHVLKNLHVKSDQIIKDYFPGLV